jgi:hypothetical protein
MILVLIIERSKRILGKPVGKKEPLSYLENLLINLEVNLTILAMLEFEICFNRLCWFL